MSDAPEIIHATMNGRSTTIACGGPYTTELIGGWSETARKPHAVRYVRADLYDALRAQVEAMRPALAFYADTSKYPAPLTGGMGALWADCGEIAKAALSKTTGSPDGQA